MRIFNKMKKTMLVLAASLFCANVAFADTKTVYSWESPDGTVVETGGKAASSANSWVKNGEVGVTEEHVNLKQTATDLTVDPSVSTDYWVMRLSGNDSHIDVVDQSTLEAKDYGRCAHVVITLDQPLAEGDQITVTGFRNKNAANKVANLYIRFDNESGKVAELKDADDETPYANIHTEGGVDLDNDGNLPTSKTYTVPAEAAGLSKIVLTRSKSGTNVFITKLDITREEAAGGDETTALDFTAYDASIAYAKEKLATIDAEADAELYEAISMLIEENEAFKAEIAAATGDEAWSQTEVDNYAADFMTTIDEYIAQNEVNKLMTEVEEIRLEADSLINAYPEEIRTDEAGLIVAMQTLPRFARGYTVEEIQNLINAVKVAMPLFKAENDANLEALNAPFADGVYYMKNVASGQFITAGEKWGTCAVFGEHGLDFTIAAQADGTYAIDSKIDNGNNKHYFGADGWMDAAVVGWKITRLPNGNYTLTTNGTNYMGYDAANVWNTQTKVSVNQTDATAEAAQWAMLTKEDMIATLAGATVNNPADATFFISCPNFGRNDTRFATAWQGSPKRAGANDNMNAEKWNCTFDVYQDLAGLPNGYYTLSVQGFYRAGNGGATATDQNALLYANDVTTPLVNILSEAGNVSGASSVEGYEGTFPNSQSEASAAFTAGYYAGNSLTVQVTDGTLKIGLKKDVELANDWTIFDNFELYYVGTEDPEAQYLALAVDSLNTLIADAEAWKATLSAEDATQAQVIQMIEGMIPSAQAVAAAPESLAQVNEMITSVYQFMASTKAQLAQMAAQAAQAVLASYEDATDNVGFEAAINKVYAVANSFFSAGEEGVVYTIADLDAAVAEMKAAQEAFVNENKPVETLVEITSEWIVNPTVNSSQDGWTSNTNAQNKALATNKVATSNGNFEGKFLENWLGSAITGEIYQEIADLPAGAYKFQISAFAELQSAGTAGVAYVFANESTVEVNTLEAAVYSVDVTLAEQGTLKIGMRISGGANWVGIDNAKLFQTTTTTLGAEQNALAEVVDSVAKLKASYAAPVEVEALDAAVAAIDNSTIESCKASVEALYKAMDAFVEANEFNLKLLALADATAENPMDATFLIKNPNFTVDGSYWEGAPAIGGEASNSCAEKWNCTFDVYQDVTNMPDGLYTVSVQGFYRAGGGGTTGTEQNALLYANDVTTPLVNILSEAGNAAITGKVATPEGYGNVPDDMASASRAFTAGLYANNSLQVVVEGGTLRIGVKKDVELSWDWAIFDNFQLTYHGVANPELDAAVDSLNTLIAEATAWKAELNAEDEFHAQVIGMLDQMIPAAQAVADARESLETVNQMIFDVYSTLGTYKPMVEQYDAKVAASAAIEEAKALLATYTEYTDAAGFVAAIANAENALTDVNMGMVTLEELTAAVEAMKVAQEAFVKENKVAKTNWDFAALTASQANKTGVTCSDELVKVGGIDSNLGTGEYEGLAFQGADKWFTYTTTGGLYQGNGGGRKIGVLDLTAGQVVTVVASEADSKGNVGECLANADETTATVTSVETADGKTTFVYTMIADGTLALTMTRYYTLYSISVATPEPDKIAYLNKEGDTDDAIYDALVAAGYVVDALPYADSTLTAEMIEANLAGYDLVVLGGSTGSGENLAKTANLLVGKVNVLSTKSFWYKHYGVNGGNPGSADAPSISMAKTVAAHPIYNGIEGDEFAVFNDMAKANGRYLQSNGTFNDWTQKTLGTTLGADCIGETWVDGKGYVIVPVDGLQPSGYLTADGAQLFANIAAYLIAGEEYVAPVVDVTGITLDQAVATVEAGATVTLVATVTPEDATDKTVVWTSSDEAIATVADGVVTGVAAGEVTITAQAGEFTATCTITVTEADGINGIYVDGWAAPANIYDVNGRMIKQGATSLEGLQKGLYIINGKKVLVK